jgi:hypothetical protein
MLGIFGVAACLVLVIWATRLGASHERRSSGDVLAPSGVASSAPGVPVGSDAEAPSPDPLSRSDLPEEVRRFIESTPYPASSGRLTRDHQDLLFPNRRYERHRPIADTLGPDPSGIVTWRLTADRWAYVGPEVVRISLEVLRGDEPLAVEIVEASATREDEGGRTGAAEPIEFFREGNHLLAELPLASFSDHMGTILVDVRFEYAPGRFHTDELRLFSTPERRVPGRVAGPIRDRVTAGNLVLEVPVDLVSSGFYRFDANLYDAYGEPVAFVSFKGELSSGPQQIPLEVYGKVLRDAGVPGPYTVGELRGYRFLDGQFPDREFLAPIEEAFSTRAWSSEDFTDAPHVSEHELRMAALMLEDLAAGVPLPQPPVALDGSEATSNEVDTSGADPN